MTTEDRVWIEKFYMDLETGHRGADKRYSRPKDYLERGLRILTGTRKSVGVQYEGVKRFKHEEH